MMIEDPGPSLRIDFELFVEYCQSETFTDVTLITETKKYQVHKIILSACSPFLSKLFKSTTCQHPTVFVPEIPDAQMELLIEQMYTGKASVKLSDLEAILRTAASLQIAGLTTPQQSPEPPGREKDESGYGTGSIHSSASGRQSCNSGKRKEGGGGRKSSKPKKLCLNSPDEPEKMRKSPLLNASPCLPTSTNDKPALSSSSPAKRIMSTVSSSSDDNIASEVDVEFVINQPLEQPVDLSTSCPCEPEVNKLQPRTKITRGLRLKSQESLEMITPMMGTLSEKLAANLAKAVANIKEKGTEEKENKDPSPLMAPTMRLDIAAQIKNNFDILRTLSGLQGAGKGGTIPKTSPVGKEVKRPTPPEGGIWTGEIGHNGKPSVECEECGKKLADPSSLYRHKKIHTGERKHKCPYPACNFASIQRYNMRQHFKTHLKNLSTQEIHAAMARI